MMESTTMSEDLRRRLPAVNTLLGHSLLAGDRGDVGDRVLTRAVRETLTAWRARLGTEGAALPDEATLIAEVRAAVGRQRCRRARPVFNLTGTVIHTNLGRSPLGERAIEAVVDAARHPVALEYALETGGRGDRDNLVEELLIELTGAEAATVVNNNAAAVLLALTALGAGREAIISRGEMIEIGGAFRMPDVMTAAGCRLVEVGATNRTHARDFRGALSEQSGLIVKAHTSNYHVEGFTASVPETELAAIAHGHGIPFMIDLGSGALTDFRALGLPHEVRPSEAIAAGADLVTFSGDKLLGGPQAGIVVGRRELISRLKQHPLKRALRCDKLILAALEATLSVYRDSEAPARELPTLAMLTRAERDIVTQAERLLPALGRAVAGIAECAVRACRSQLGSGSLPVDRLDSAALVLTSPSGRELGRLERALRQLPRPVIGRVHDGALWLDLRCLASADDEQVFVDQLEFLPDAWQAAT
ncbi:L-seryl-tRNA(Sec) selenium transferase [Salinicola rhizosphaerae]|uniref:L-seryl-tRNA(Sec) selenium transferase n=1 Tax=Salinicola rhizosphaerae TaxID=1443141 RepID=A0ABQ3EEM2_9GAMM|nr:L-seryl-tRNA(Sec) selenium transferase [Salinicola rhizosphaerae]GHB31670.1 L-seryl-tRNA(Sec) selenium transferase [Salinicola rhizosphaerae]